jgi:hypothetical protein
MSGISKAFANQINKTKRFFLSHQQCDDVFRQNEVCTTPGDLIKIHTESDLYARAERAFLCPLTGKANHLT